MPRMKEEVRVGIANIWSSRIDAANQHYDNWAKKFSVRDLEEAYYGFQWEECGRNEEGYRPYVMNMIFSSIDVKMPSLLFNEPVYHIEPRPSKYDFDPSGAKMRARLREDVLNYAVQGGIKHFTDEIEDAILDAFFRFGMIEVGYSADYVTNPDAGKPYLVSEKTPLTDRNGKVVQQPEVLTAEEQIYIRRIPAQRFRVGGTDHRVLERCSWYGYKDYINKEDLYASAKINDGYYIDAIEKTGAASTPDARTWYDNDFAIYQNNKERESFKDVVGVWKIYDNRSKTMRMFNDSVSDIIYEEEITRIRHFPIKFRNMLKGFYPLPPVFNWASPQEEVNETREAARIHRRRFQRKYVYGKGAFSQENIDKLQNGADGTMVETESADPINKVVSVDSPNINAQNDQAMMVAKDDFNTISATSAEQRGQSDRTTATQSQIKENRSIIRESRDKAIVAVWLIKLGKEILKTIKDEMVLPFWTKVSQDTPQLFEEMTAIEHNWKLIVAEELGDEDFEVKLKVSSLSPVDREQEKAEMLEFLSIVSQYPQVAMSPIMIQEIADRTGFRNERAIAELVRSAQLLQTMQVIQLAQQTGQDPLQVLMLTTFMRNAQPGQENPIAQRTVAQLTPPDMETIRNQVQNQIVQ